MPSWRLRDCLAFSFSSVFGVVVVNVRCGTFFCVTSESAARLLVPPPPFLLSLARSLTSYPRGHPEASFDDCAHACLHACTLSLSLFACRQVFTNAPSSPCLGIPLGVGPLATATPIFMESRGTKTSRTRPSVSAAILRQRADDTWHRNSLP